MSGNILLRSKVYGITGILLTSIGFMLSFKYGVFFILDVIGILLFTLSIKIIADYYNDNKIFKYSIISLLITMAGYGLSFFLPHNISIGYDFTMLSIRVPGGLFILILLISSIFLYVPYSKISKLTGIKDFDTGSSLIMIGFILSIILVGFLVMIAGIIYAFSAYDNLKVKQNKTVNPMVYDNM